MSIKAADLFNVNGLVAVVTGGSSGLGSFIAHALAENGAKKIFITGRRADKLKLVASKYPNVIVPFEGDVVNQQDLARLADHIRDSIGYINLLVANAGVNDRSALEMGENPTVKTIQDFLCSLPEGDWSRVFQVNLSASIYTVAHFLSLLEAGNAARNVPMSSQVVAMSAIATYMRDAPPGGFAYTASKAALTHMFKVLSTMLAPHKIRANVICPGLYHSEMADPIIQSIKDSTLDGSIPVVPENRAGTPEDMAGVILFLASKAGAFCNGNVLISDGGTISVAPASY